MLLSVKCIECSIVTGIIVTVFSQFLQLECTSCEKHIQGGHQEGWRVSNLRVCLRQRKEMKTNDF